MGNLRRWYHEIGGKLVAVLREHLALHFLEVNIAKASDGLHDTTQAVVLDPATLSVSVPDVLMRGRVARGVIYCSQYSLCLYFVVHSVVFRERSGRGAFHQNSAAVAGVGARQAITYATR